DWHPATDQNLLAGMLERLAGIPAARQIPAIAEKLPDDRDFAKTAKRLFDSSQLGIATKIETLLEMNPQQLTEISDPLLQWMIELYPHYLKLRERDKEVEGKLAQAYGELIDVKRQFLDSRFIPDANATLRMTFGHVRGYSPSDAIHKSPITTLRGLLEKTTGVEPFITPKEVLDAHEQGQFANLIDPATGQVPVAILYDTDTTGGNSGSPVFNARGELVGVNFDRTFEATINDFAWNPDYSRSIAVDIRFVLWVTGVAYPGQHIVREMGVELP
ncbi:MAG: S46 family peptidase, partial [Pirellulaceae bacterium]